MNVLKGHTARVSKVVFAGDGNEGGDGGEAVSCGFDSTVRKWDVESGVCTTTIVSVLFFSSTNLFKLVYMCCVDGIRKTLPRRLATLHIPFPSLRIFNGSNINSL